MNSICFSEEDDICFRVGRQRNGDILDIYQALEKILGKPELSFSQLVHDHLLLLLKEFQHYFSTTKNPQIGKECICNPFVNKPCKSSMSLQKDQLLESANDARLKTTFETATLLVFWIKFMAEYPEITTTSLKTLLSFPTSYLCKAWFSAVTATKKKTKE